MTYEWQNPGILRAVIETRKELRCTTVTVFGEDGIEYDKKTLELEKELLKIMGCGGKGCYNDYCDDC